MQPFPSMLASIVTSRYFWPLAALVLLLSVNVIITPEFFALTFEDGRIYGSLVDILNRAVPVGLLAIGMSLVIATGGIDLSVGAVMAIAGAICANLIVTGVDSLPLLLLVGLAAGIFAGLVNGSLVSFLGIQPIVATLVLMVAGRGIAQLISDGQIITFHHEAFAFLGVGDFLALPFPVILLLLVFVAVQLLLRKTALGLFVESVGCNPTASRYMGLNVSGIKLFVYAVSGFCAALAGIVVTADIQGADSNNAGLWLELDAILAVVIGGASLYGGRFSLPLSLIGVLIIQTLSTTIIMSGIEPRYNLVIKAAVVITVLLLQSPVFRQQLQRLSPRRVVESAKAARS